MEKTTENKAPIVIVAGMSKDNKGIGKDNELLWHVPEDLKRFKSLTSGHPVIMGRKTFDSILAILGKPLPGRTNIVITRDPNYQKDDAVTASSLDEAIAIARNENPEEIHIGGGAEIYKQALPLTDKIYATYFHAEKEADTFFPDFEAEFEAVAEHEVNEHNGLTYQWVDYVRK